jgi:hypothetical protein
VDNQTSYAYCSAPLNGSSIPEIFTPCNALDPTDPFPIPPNDPVRAWAGPRPIRPQPRLGLPLIKAAALRPRAPRLRLCSCWQWS